MGTIITLIVLAAFHLLWLTTITEVYVDSILFHNQLTPMWFSLLVWCWTITGLFYAGYQVGGYGE